jgi:hypothetical protein
LIDSKTVQIELPAKLGEKTPFWPLRRPRCAAFVLTLLFALALPVEADVGIPMLAVTWPGMLLALIPVVLIEAWVVKSRLRLKAKETVRVVFWANVLSTIIGIPLAWLVLLVLDMVVTSGGTAMGLDTPWRRFLAVTVQAPWLVPYSSELYWMVPSATLALLPAYFVASWAIEYKAMQLLFRRRWTTVLEQPQPHIAVQAVRSSALYANLASYAMLAVVTVIWLGISIWATTKSPRRLTDRALERAQSLSEANAAPTLQGPRRSVRVEFQNPLRQNLKIEVRIGAGGCAVNPVLHTQEVKGDVGWVLTAFAEVDEKLCYRVAGDGGPSKWGEWHLIDRREGPKELAKGYQVILR